MTTLATRVRAWREARGLNTAELARQVGTSRQNIENLERGEVDNPRYLINLARVMGTTAEDLLGRPASVQLSVSEPLGVYDQHNAAQSTSSLARVPLINRVPGGDWETLIDALAPGDAERFIETTANVGARGFALTVTGHSMVSPAGPHSFPPGTILFVNPELDPQPGHFVVVRHNADSEFTFKRLARDAGRWVLEPLNPRYDVLPLPDDAHICGVVVKAEISTL